MQITNLDHKYVFGQTQAHFRAKMSSEKGQKHIYAQEHKHVWCIMFMSKYVFVVCEYIIMRSKTICMHSIRKHHRAPSVTCEPSET